LESEIEAQEETVAEKEAALEEAEDRVDEIEEIRSHVGDAQDKYDEIDDLQNAIDRHELTVGNCDEQIQDLNQRISTLESEKEALEEELGDTDVDSLRDDRDKLEERIEELEEDVEDYESEIHNLRDERMSLEKDLDSLRELKEDIDRYERQYQWADAVICEIDTMLAAYRGSKSELREQYLGYLREYTNEIFDEVYKNSSYQQVVIREVENKGDFQYDLKLLRNDGDLEDPSNASGGERAIVNLALRAGLYRLIAELEGGDRGKLPPFILDEPTTFLDEGHVGQLEEMLNTIKSWDVPQVIVVSHEESLIHGADHECRITIDEETNTSQVEMRAAGGDEAAIGDD
jgi:DNA repair exonuclease SbcCD ATPase subunit